MTFYTELIFIFLNQVSQSFLDFGYIADFFLKKMTQVLKNKLATFLYFRVSDNFYNDVFGLFNPK
jgi:hypothetical protein